MSIILAIGAGLLIGYCLNKEKHKMDCAKCYQTWYGKNVTHE